jgi:hypothetical protein
LCLGPVLGPSESISDTRAGLKAAIAKVDEAASKAQVGTIVKNRRMASSSSRMSPRSSRDGYHALVDVLRQPDLRRRSRDRVAGMVDQNDRADPRALRWYAIATAAWTALGDHAYRGAAQPPPRTERPATPRRSRSPASRSRSAVAASRAAAVGPAQDAASVGAFSRQNDVGSGPPAHTVGFSALDGFCASSHP